MADPDEQRRQRRAVALVLAGVIVLGGVGIAASVMFVGGPCDDLLQPSFTSPPAVVDGGEVIEAVAPDADGPAVAADVVAVSEALGLGPVRGATPVSGDVTAIPVDDAVFVVADDRHVRIVDTGIVAVATGRERSEQTTFVPAGEQVGVVQRDLAGDVLLARYDEDLSLTGCREIEPAGVVTNVSRGIALVSRGDRIEAVGIDGGRLWAADGVPGTPAVDGATTGLLAVIASRAEVAALDVRTGELRWSVTRGQLGDTLADDPVLLAGDDVVVVATRSSVVRLDARDGRVLATDAVAGTATDAVATRAGVVVLAGSELLRFAADEAAERTALPAPATSGLAVLAGDVLVATEAGLVRSGADGGEAVVARGLPVTSVAVAGGYTVVGVDVGEGFLAFYGPATPASATS